MAGFNGPVARYRETYTWMFNYNTPMVGNASVYDRKTEGHNLELMEGTNGVAAFYNLLRPAEVADVDNKIDDGIPSMGKIVVYKSPNNNGCTTSDVDALAQYNLSTNNIVCSLAYRDLF